MFFKQAFLTDYIVELKDMIQHGINNGTYETLQEDTLQGLKRIQGFLLRNLTLKITKIMNKCIQKVINW